MYASCSFDLLTRRGPDTFIPQVAKLFAKHMKLEEQASFLASKRFLFAVGTPNRILKLLEMGALSLQQTRLVVLDSTWTDAKKRNIFDVVRKNSCVLLSMCCPLLWLSWPVVIGCHWGCLLLWLSWHIVFVTNVAVFCCGCRGSPRLRLLLSPYLSRELPAILTAARSHSVWIACLPPPPNTLIIAFALTRQHSLRSAGMSSPC